MSEPEGIDPRLVARLLRHQRPGLIGLGVARRILGAVEQMAGRLPLLARFPRAVEHSRAGETPIVHAPPAAPRAGAPGAVEAPGLERNALPGERATHVVTARTVEREQRIERRIEHRIERVERSAPPSPMPPSPPPSSVVAEPPGRSAMQPPETGARRSRMGAPVVKPPLPHAVPVVAPAARSVVNAPVVATPVAVQPRSPAAATPPSAPAVVVPRRSSPDGGPARPPVPTRAAARPRAVEAAPAREPAVPPRRSLAPVASSSLVHVAPTAGAEASRSDAPAPAPLPAPPRALASPTMPPPQGKAVATAVGQPLQRADLPEIASHVQRILERQAMHDRARRGLRR